MFAMGLPAQYRFHPHRPREEERNLFDFDFDLGKGGRPSSSTRGDSSPDGGDAARSEKIRRSSNAAVADDKTNFPYGVVVGRGCRMRGHIVMLVSISWLSL